MGETTNLNRLAGFLPSTVPVGKDTDLKRYMPHGYLDCYVANVDPLRSRKIHLKGLTFCSLSHCINCQ